MSFASWLLEIIICASGFHSRIETLRWVEISALLPLTVIRAISDALPFLMRFFSNQNRMENVCLGVMW